MPITKSPLRYPGGKTQLSRYVRHLLDINNVHNTYIEPFAGGFGVALELLFNNDVDQIVMNDFDPSIYSIWNIILNNRNEFINLIKNTPITIEEWFYQKDIRNKLKNDSNSIENAFATFFLNRTNVSGIISAGPIGGLKQQGKYKIDCRFNKEKLIDKINRIYDFRDRIILFNLDANDFIKYELPNFSNSDTFIFYDPPYFKQGQNLYLSFINEKEHDILSQNIISYSKDYKWIVTYDTQSEIYDLYAPYVQSYGYNLHYYANKKRLAKEFLFANNNTIVESFGNVNLVSLN
ncbi:DNA adenine methylase [Ligilactobacillus salivarius]|uniref:DNA adenine methylase n=1 Tax=Ligilactobacillus salivarius TaxID=1624 RepID=UPI0031FE9A6D